MKKVFLILCVCALPLVVHAQITKLPAGFTSGKTVWMVRLGGGISSVIGDGIDASKKNWEDSKPNKKWNCNGDFKSATVPSLSIGFNKSFGSGPVYWGMELGVGMRGYKTEVDWTYGASSSVSGGYDYHSISMKETLNAYNVQFSPINIGYKYIINDNMAVDIHVGGFASYDFAGKCKIENNDHYYSTSKYGNNLKDTNTETSNNIGDVDNYRQYDFGAIGGVGFWYGHFNIDVSYQRGFISIYDVSDSYFMNKLQVRLGYAF